MMLRLAVLCFLLQAAAAQAAPRNVGFETVSMQDGAAPAIEVGIWYPTQAAATPSPLGSWTQTVATAAPPTPGRHPLVVLSHGNGGWFAGHHDTAFALAKAGFVVAALTHPGDNYRDQSRAIDMPARPRALHQLIDYMLVDWPRHNVIDPGRIGAFGFSSGGFTVLVVIGGMPDFARFQAHCKAHPAYFDCALASRHGAPADTAQLFPPSVWVHDRRIKAAIVEAPALGFTFTPAGLKNVTIPLQIWRAADDQILPNPDYAEAVHRNLPRPHDYIVEQHAMHLDFLAPCSPDMAKTTPFVCHSEPGFDRAAFHDTALNPDIVAFFQQTLGPARPRIPSLRSDQTR